MPSKRNDSNSLIVQDAPGKAPPTPLLKEIEKSKRYENLKQKVNESPEIKFEIRKPPHQKGMLAIINSVGEVLSFFIYSIPGTKTFCFPRSTFPQHDLNNWSTSKKLNYTKLVMVWISTLN